MNLKVYLYLYLKRILELGVHLQSQHLREKDRRMDLCELEAGFTQ